MKQIAIAALCLALFGCAADAQNTITITAADNGWVSQKVHNEIARLVVERAFDGYTFKTSAASSAMNWQALLAGQNDLSIECWTDNVATYKADKQRGDIVDVGVLVVDSAQGVYVPRYVIEGDAARGIAPAAPGLKTVEDLKNYAAVFPDDENPARGRLYGAIPGWLVDEILYKKYEYYGLDATFNYMRLGSEATLFASLMAAYNLGEPWAGYCYEPTWIAGKLDLVRLEDAPYDAAIFHEGKCEFPVQPLKIVANRDFAQKAPDLLPFFQNYHTGGERVSAMLAYVDETGATVEQAAVWFLRQYDELIDEWLPAENAARLRAHLATLPGGPQ